jgi:hypothetical protein
LPHAREPRRKRGAADEKTEDSRQSEKQGDFVGENCGRTSKMSQGAARAIRHRAERLASISTAPGTQGGSSMARKHRRGRRRLSQFRHDARPVSALANSDILYSEYHPLTIILVSRSRQGSVSFMTAGALFVIAAILLFVFSR